MGIIFDTAGNFPCTCILLLQNTIWKLKLNTKLQTLNTKLQTLIYHEHFIITECKLRFYKWVVLIQSMVWFTIFMYAIWYFLTKSNKFLNLKNLQWNNIHKEKPVLFSFFHQSVLEERTKKVSVVLLFFFFFLHIKRNDETRQKQEVL